LSDPAHSRSQLLLIPLAAGKDHYAEKTMTWSIPEADRCLNAAKSSDIVV
jgi:predicted dehydrogenase